MGLNEMLFKKTPPQYHDDLGALGMAGTFVQHSRIATALSRYIQEELDSETDGYYEAVVEARARKGAKAKIYDVCIKSFTEDIENDWGKNIIIIEIVHGGIDFEKAKTRILETFVEDTNLCEGYIYDYKDKVWLGYKKRKGTGQIDTFTTGKESYTTYNFGIDLESKILKYYHKLKIYKRFMKH